MANNGKESPTSIRFTWAEKQRILKYAKMSNIKTLHAALMKLIMDRLDQVECEYEGKAKTLYKH